MTNKEELFEKHDEKQSVHESDYINDKFHKLLTLISYQNKSTDHFLFTN